MLIPYVGLSFAWSIFLVKNFLEDFPQRADRGGARSTAAGRSRRSSTSCCPTCLRPIFAVGILQFLFCWNSLLIPLLFLRTSVPLPVIFAQISGTYDPNWDLRAVAAIVTTIVPLIVFLVFQRQFAAGAHDPRRQQGIDHAQPPNKPLRYRQIHLDFHTSEHIPAIGAAFDPDDFVATLKAAHVDSITLFAKCHHGWSYYPTKVGEPHPHLARPDLLGDMVAALKRGRHRGADLHLRAVGRAHRARASRMAGDERHQPLPARAARRSVERQEPEPGLAHDLPQPQGLSPTYMLDQAREVHARYAPPGLFFDIVLTPDCVCAACLARMEANGLDPENPADRLANDECGQRAVPQRDERARCSAEFPGVRIFYNCGHIHKQGPQRFATYTHLELESLPTGGWGYDHFPSSARYAATLGFDFVGHTGKFHTSWGEFGGFKHPDALEYECGADGGARHQVSGRRPAPPERRDQPRHLRLDRAGLCAHRKARALSRRARGRSREIADPVGRAFPPGRRAQQRQRRRRRADAARTASTCSTSSTRSARFEDYRLLILPDEIPVDGALADAAQRLCRRRRQDHRVMAFGPRSRTARSPLDAGIKRGAEPVAFRPVLREGRSPISTRR